MAFLVVQREYDERLMEAARRASGPVLDGYLPTLNSVTGNERRAHA
jgi:hypothetical protein